MAEDAAAAAENLTPPGNAARSTPFSLFTQFTSNSELLSYLILCVAKMPFIPPVGSVARPRSVSVTATFPKTAKMPPTDKAAATPSSVKERLASNLKQLGRRSQPRSRLPTGKPPAGLSVEGRNPWLRPSQRLPHTPAPGSSGGSSFPTSSSGESVTQTQQQQRRSVSRHSAAKSGGPEDEEEEARFTLTLTPEAVVILQRRSAEKQRANRRQINASKPRGGGGGGGGGGGAPGGNRAGNYGSSVVIAPGDVGSMLKISLLNERHKYDDVEYEEEDDVAVVDERVVRKCTEWLRGLEGAPVTLRQGPATDKSATLKSF